MASSKYQHLRAALSTFYSRTGQFPGNKTALSAAQAGRFSFGSIKASPNSASPGAEKSAACLAAASAWWAGGAIIFCSFLLFVPSFVSTNFFGAFDSNTRGLSTLLQDPGFRGILIATIVLVCPMLVEACLEFWLAPQRAANVTDRIVLSSIVVLPNAVTLLLPASASSSPYFSACLTSMQLMSLFGCIVATATQLVPKRFSPRSSLGTIVLFCILQVVAVYEESLSGSSVASGSAYWLLVLFTIAYTALSGYWFACLARNVLFRGIALEANDCVVGVYLITWWAFALTATVYDPSLMVVDWERASPSSCIARLILVSFLVNFLLIMPGRVAAIFVSSTQERLESKRAFVRFVSHELRSPLGALNATLDMVVDLMEAADDNSIISDDLNEMIIDAHIASNSAVHILTDLLNFECIEGGTFKLDIQTMSIKDFMEGKMRSVTMHARVHGVELRVLDMIKATGDEASTFITSSSQAMLNKCYLKIDVAKIYDQVLVNLVSNVIKYAETGETITLVFSTTDDISSFNDMNQYTGSAADPLIRGKLVVEILSDNAPMLSKEEVDEIYDQFEHFDTSVLKGNGSGLDLWISNQIMTMHGGIIGFYHFDPSATFDKNSGSAPDTGSKFFFELPLYDLPEETAAAVLPGYTKCNTGNMNHESPQIAEDAAVVVVRGEEPAYRSVNPPAITYQDANDDVYESRSASSWSQNHHIHSYRRRLIRRSKKCSSSHHADDNDHPAYDGPIQRRECSDNSNHDPREAGLNSLRNSADFEGYINRQAALFTGTPISHETSYEADFKSADYQQAKLVHPLEHSFAGFALIQPSFIASANVASVQSQNISPSSNLQGVHHQLSDYTAGFDINVSHVQNNSIRVYGALDSPLAANFMNYTIPVYPQQMANSEFLFPNSPFANPFAKSGPSIDRNDVGTKANTNAEELNFVVPAAAIAGSFNASEGQRKDQSSSGSNSGGSPAMVSGVYYTVRRGSKIMPLQEPSHSESPSPADGRPSSPMPCLPQKTPSSDSDKSDSKKLEYENAVHGNQAVNTSKNQIRPSEPNSASQKTDSPLSLPSLSKINFEPERGHDAFALRRSYFSKKPPATRRSLRIMLVDDSELHRKVLKRMINHDKLINSNMSVELLEADDGGPAVDLAEKSMKHNQPIDCILLDYTMGKMHGPDAARIIREHYRFGGLILGVTGNALPEDVAHFKTCGADEVYIKPFKIKSLHDAFKTVGLPIPN